jgi:hypothetical protein
VKKDSQSYKIDRRMGPKQVTLEPDINFPKCTKVGWEINSREEQIQRLLLEEENIESYLIL